MFGAARYKRMLIDVLSEKYKVKCFDVRPHLFRKAKRPQIVVKIIMKELTSNFDLWIRDNLAVAAMNKRSLRRKNIAIFHHIDDSAIPYKCISKRITQLFFKKAHNCDCIVVVSKYWKDYLESKGLNRIQIIYNSFDVKSFKFTEKDVNNFKYRYGLLDKPVIYIGNCQKRKGVVEVYKVLKSLDVHLVTSGSHDVQLPIRKFLLDYSQYILLLAASDVVITMSKFLEGWNCTAHEAMLCKTPVIGSGKGGMKELLLGGQQIICEDFNKLPDIVGYTIKNDRMLGNKGYNYASKFTVERFAAKWLVLISKILNNEEIL